MLNDDFVFFQNYVSVGNGVNAGKVVNGGSDVSAENDRNGGMDASAAIAAIGQNGYYFSEVFGCRARQS